MKPTVLWTATAVTLALLASCNPGTSGLFASIESETKIVANGDLAVKSTVTSMAEDASLQYAVGVGNGSGKLYTRSATSLGTWKADPAVTDSVLAVAGQGDGKVYRLMAGTSSSVVEWNHSGTWSAVTLNAADSPVNLVPVTANDGHTVSSVIVVTQKSDGSYQNVYLLKGTGTAVGPVDLSPNISTPVTSAAVNGSGYLLVNRSSLWTTGTDLASPAVVSTAAVSEYAAVLNVSGVTGLNGLYLATRRIGNSGGSIVLGTLSGTAFTTTKSIVTGAKDTSSTLLDFTTLIVPPGSTPQKLLAGTASSGYGELDQTSWTVAPTAATADVNNYSVSALPGAPILFFFVSPVGTGTLYLGTNSLGLWSQKSDKTWSN